MAFRLADLVIDRVVSGVAQSPSTGKLLYLLKNLQDCTIDITADSRDAVDGSGAVIHTFYNGKTGTLTATNSLVSLPIIAAMSGTDPKYSSEDNPLSIPKIIETSKTKDIVLSNIKGDGTDVKIAVNAVTKENALGDEYTLGTAGEGQAAGTYSITDGKMTIVPKDDDEKFIIKYDRDVTENGIQVVNYSDKFPKVVRLVLKVLIVDPCEEDVVRAFYLDIPSFQPSAELSFGMATDTTLDYTGNLHVSYCAKQKVLFVISACGDDRESQDE